MYENEGLNKIIECIENYRDAFTCKEHQLTVLNTFVLLVDKFDLDIYMDEYHFTPSEYKKYFKHTTKKYNKPLHKIIKKEFKNG